jgi:hypothetical protein
MVKDIRLDPGTHSALICLERIPGILERHAKYRVLFRQIVQIRIHAGGPVTSRANYVVQRAISTR